MEANRPKTRPAYNQKTHKKPSLRAAIEPGQPICTNIELHTALGDLKERLVKRTCEMHKAREKTRQAGRVNAKVLANISQKIHPPMSNLIGTAQRMLKTSLDANQRMYVETLSQSGSSLLQSVEDVLDLSRAQAGFVKIRQESFNLQRAMKEVVNQLSARTGKKHKTIGLLYNSHLPAWFDGDSEKIRQIIIGFVENIIKSDQSGEVRIFVDGVLGKETVDLQFLVRDSVSNKTLAHKNFYNGLGFAVANRFVDLLGGKTEVSFDPEKGTDFIVHLTLRIAQNTRPGR